MIDKTKRWFLKQGLCGLSVYGVGSIWSNALLADDSNPQNIVLASADKNGVRLPTGYSSRIVARSGQAVITGKDFLWHAAPDGGACFATDKGGWIYVSNSEMSPTGGAGALVFDANGEVTDAYSILENTNSNCAGGATPWGSWLSCEETDSGQVWECYPDGKKSAVMRPALGVFNHEAVTVDTINHHLYLTEDKKDGCLYRFTADSFFSEDHADLSSGLLEVATRQKDSDKLAWADVPDPQASRQATRYQVPSAMTFNGGEGIAYYDGKIIFTTKGDNRVWSYHTQSQQLGILYDASDFFTPLLTGVDNVTVSKNGDIYVAEDGGDLQIVVIDGRGELYPIAQLEGHDRSEITGIAFSPDGKRLYFSSQRGISGQSENGVTYEIQGF